jgi:hypothetical protein
MLVHDYNVLQPKRCLAAVDAWVKIFSDMFPAVFGSVGAVDKADGAIQALAAVQRAGP